MPDSPGALLMPGNLADLGLLAMSLNPRLRCGRSMGAEHQRPSGGVEVVRMATAMIAGAALG